MGRFILLAASCLAPCLVLTGMMIFAENRHVENRHEEREHQEIREHPQNSVPEIGTGAMGSSIALASCALLLIADRRRKQVTAQTLTA